jgi:hypothetical protein
VQLIWGYTPTTYEQTIASEWFAAHDLSAVDVVAIGEGSLVMSVEPLLGKSGVTVRLKRHWDLGADLAAAIEQLNGELGSR